MHHHGTRPTIPLPADPLRFARSVLLQEARALSRLSRQLDDRFLQAVRLMHDCQGSVIVTGMGKAGLIGQKIAATLASTGTRSHFLHPAEALRGDLGRIDHRDCALVLSYSGETDEILRLLPSLLQLPVPIIAITGQPMGSLARAARVVLDIGPVQEACWLGLAPTTSTTLMLALGDALALALSRARGFTAGDFARFHPAGNLGLRLSRVEDVMRPKDDCRVAQQEKTLREILVAVRKPGRRTGAIMLTDADGKLTGIFTDSDLARLLEQRRDPSLDQPVQTVMTRSPAYVTVGTMTTEAVRILVERKISELPVIDSHGVPQGMIDITDIVGLLPKGAGWADAPAVCNMWRPSDRHVLPVVNRSAKSA